MEAFLDEFKQEASELFQRLEQCLLDIEKAYRVELLDEIYRHVHTLKGGAGMFGLSQMAALAHELESCFSNIKDNKRSLSPDLVDLSLQAIDLFKSIVAGTSNDQDIEHAIGRVRKMAGNNSSEESTTQHRILATGCYAILLKPEKTIFKRGINFEAILQELQGLGTCNIFVHHAETSLEEQFARKEMLSSFEIFFQSSITRDQLEDVLLFLKTSEKKVFALSNENFYDTDYAAWFTLSDHAIEERRSTIRELLGKVAAVCHEDEDDKRATASPSTELSYSQKNSYINVATTKLDHLINVVSELVIFRSELQHLLEGKQDPMLVESIEKLDRLTLSLRDSAFSIRLVPLNIVSTKFQRLVRTLCDDLGKEVDFMMDGLHTELDRSMISALEAPLMHLIRNALDHGIETIAERKAANKPERGLLKLFSYNSGDHVFIQLQDDGGGINFEKIRRRAIEAGIITREQQLSEKELLNVMMMPGFSTADTVTSVSGRGVGMDVVKKEIAALRGDLEISTEQGLGSIFTIRLPLTLTVLDTLVVQVDTNKYLLPVSEIEHCYKVSGGQLFHKPIRQINYRGQLIPFISLREQFDHENPDMEHTMVVINKNDQKLGVVVDAIVGSLQTVYKPLNDLLHHLDCFSGTSILGDGTMAFIINPLKLIQR